MNILAIDRSTDVLSVALSMDGRVRDFSVDGADARGADWPIRVHDFLAVHGLTFCDLGRIVVGMGPGSFAGIRGALSFAQGMAIGIKSKRPEAVSGPIVYGLPSAAALASDDRLVAVIGDARRGLFWVVAYDGVKTVADFRLTGKEDLVAAVPDAAVVTTSDGARIGETLESLFGERFAGSLPPSAKRLAVIAAAHPELSVPEPLPIYLSPAVRT